MSEKPVEKTKSNFDLLAEESLKRGSPSGWFDTLYQQAQNDPNKVPWAKMQPHPFFQDWLDNHGQSLENKDASILVIGCGLGDDAQALADLGFTNITAFDISGEAISWCQKRFPDSDVNYMVADLFDLDSNWQNKFDFVYECRNIQALPLDVRSQIINNIANLVAPEGILLVIDRLRDRSEKNPFGPPWALSDEEFDLFVKFGLQQIQIDTFKEGENEEVTTLRIQYQNDKK